MSRGCEGPTEMVMSSAGVVSGPPCCATAIVAPLAAGHFSVYAADQPAPPTTVINFDAGKTRANNLLVSLSQDGTQSVTILNDSAGTVDVVFDVNGYFK